MQDRDARLLKQADVRPWIGPCRLDDANIALGDGLHIVLRACALEERQDRQVHADGRSRERARSFDLLQEVVRRTLRVGRKEPEAAAFADRRRELGVRDVSHPPWMTGRRIPKSSEPDSKRHQR